MPIETLRYAWTRNYLSHPTQLFLVVLIIVGIYEVYLVSAVLIGLRIPGPTHDTNSLAQNLARFRDRSTNLKQAILAMSYLFGVTFFIQIDKAYFTPESNRPVGIMVLENLKVYFAFAAAVYLILFVFHLVQWFISAWIQKAAARINIGEPLK
jgi:hypothetical protein